VDAILSLIGWRRKRVTAQQYGLRRWDTILGCVTSNVVGFFVVVACGATLHHSSGQGAGITSVAETAAGLWPVAGRGACFCSPPA
jgi:Mn2+/Fe2+ NRAMP family transporter